MWTTALVLAIALNFEPTRIGITTLILIGPHPIRRLLAFLCGIFTMGLAVGMLVLFVFHRASVDESRFNAANVQLGLGAIALLLAAILATNIPLPSVGRQRPADGTVAGDDGAGPQFPKVGGIGKLLTRSADVAKGSPPWVFGALGMGMALPSVDYVAMLLVIAASGAPVATQISVLFTFLVVANLVSAIPLVSYRIAPETTLARVKAFDAWIRARTRRDVAVFIAVLGVVLIGTAAMKL